MNIISKEEKEVVIGDESMETEISNKDLKERLMNFLSEDENIIADLEDPEVSNDVEAVAVAAVVGSQRSRSSSISTSGRSTHHTPKSTSESIDSEIETLNIDGDELEDIAATLLTYSQGNDQLELKELKKFTDILNEIEELNKKRNGLNDQIKIIETEVQFEKARLAPGVEKTFTDLTDTLEELHTLHEKSSIDEKINMKSKLENLRGQLVAARLDASKTTQTIIELGESLKKLGVVKSRKNICTQILEKDVLANASLKKQYQVRYQYLLSQQSEIAKIRSQLEQRIELERSNLKGKITDIAIVPDGEVFTDTDASMFEMEYYKSRSKHQKEQYIAVEQKVAKFREQIREQQSTMIHFFNKSSGNYPHNKVKVLLLADSSLGDDHQYTLDTSSLYDIFDGRKLIYEVMDISMMHDHPVEEETKLLEQCMKMSQRKSLPQVFLIDDSEDKLNNHNTSNTNCDTLGTTIMFIGGWEDVKEIDENSFDEDTAYLDNRYTSHSRYTNHSITVGDSFVTTDFNKELEFFGDNHNDSNNRPTAKIPILDYGVEDHESNDALPSFQTVFMNVAYNMTVERAKRREAERTLLETETETLSSLEEAKSEHSLMQASYEQERYRLVTDIEYRKSVKMEFEQKRRILDMKQEREALRISSINSNLKERREQMLKELEQKEEYFKDLDDLIFTSQCFVLETFKETHGIKSIHKPMEDDTFLNVLTGIIEKLNENFIDRELKLKVVNERLSRATDVRANTMKNIIQLDREEKNVTTATNEANNKLQETKILIDKLKDMDASWDQYADHIIGNHRKNITLINQKYK